MRARATCVLVTMTAFGKEEATYAPKPAFERRFFDACVGPLIHNPCIKKNRCGRSASLLRVPGICSCWVASVGISSPSLL